MFISESSRESLLMTNLTSSLVIRVTQQWFPRTFRGFPETLNCFSLLAREISISNFVKFKSIYNKLIYTRKESFYYYPYKSRANTQAKKQGCTVAFGTTAGDAPTFVGVV